MYYKVMILAVLAAICASGCGSSETATPNTSGAQSRTVPGGNTSVNASQPAPQQSANSDPAISVSNSAVNPPPADAAPLANAGDANSADTMDPRQRKRQMIKEAQLNAQSGPPPKPVAQPAPDNSTYSVVLADAVIENRVFKSHPQLSRVEKRSDGSGSVMRVYLKDGKVLTLDGGKIQSLATVPASVIMDAAGIGTKANPARHSDIQGQKQARPN
jgi:hypothetical protein